MRVDLSGPGPLMSNFEWPLFGGEIGEAKDRSGSRA